MTFTVEHRHDDRARAFEHDALLYAGDDEFVSRCAEFLRQGLELDEPMLVLVVQRKVDMLRDALGADARAVEFGDMAEIGRNPSRIIPVWESFVVSHAPSGRRVRGIGEPIWSTRSAVELEEAQRHEALINLAFTEAEATILCPYDTTALDGAVIDEALRSHPTLVANGARTSSDSFGDRVHARFDDPLPPPPERALELLIDREGLGLVRRLVQQYGALYGLGESRSEDLALAMSEISANSLRHGGGRGVLRLWKEAGTVVCEVEDNGRFEDPLVGRRKPVSAQEGGVGLWMVNQLCDLVQLRSYPTGAIVRVHMRTL